MVAIPGFIGGVAGGASVAVIITAVDRFSATFKKAQVQSKKKGAAFNEFATVAAGVGIVLGVGLAIGLAKSIQLSTELEDAMVGVRKTTGLAGEELEDLRKTFVELSKETATSAAEFGRIAIIAGQLGIQGKEDLAKFTQVVAEMATATVLDSEEAALGLARLGAIMQEPIDNARNMASAMVGLGNTVAANEQEILAMALRLAGAGKVIGLSTAQVLGLAASLAELGIRAESGGTSFSKLFIKIQAATSKGGAQLDLFAKTAGLTTDEFVKSFRDDAGEAIVLFLEGLGRIRDEGGDVLKVLEAMNLTEIRLRDAILRVSGATEKLAVNMDNSIKLTKEGTAVGEEHAQSMDSVSKQWKMLTNRVNSFLITDNKWLKNTLIGINIAGSRNKISKELTKIMKEQGISQEEINATNERAQELILQGTTFAEGQRMAIEFLNGKLKEYNIVVGQSADGTITFSDALEKSTDKIMEQESPLDKLIKLTKEFDAKKKEIIATGAIENQTIEAVIEQLKLLEEEYPEVIKATELLIAANNELNKSFEKLDKRALKPGEFTRGLGGTTIGRGEAGVVKGKLVELLPLPKQHEPTMNDFIARPGQAPISINPEDTVVGFKGDSPMGMSIDKVEIVVQGAGQNATSIAREVQEKLSALGKPTLGIG